MEIIYLIIFIQSIFIIYLIYKTRNSENFSSATLDANIINAVNNKYKIDMDAMRNLASISKTIMSDNDTLILPASTTNAGDFNVKGKLEVAGPVNFHGNVTFTAKDTNIMEIFPKYMVIAWASDIPPNGWALCDGKWSKIGPDGRAIEGTSIDGLLTPDLRGRFVLGAGVGAKDMNGVNLRERKINDTGGAETHKLTYNEMPTHSHGGIPPYADNCWDGGGCSGDKGFVANTWEKNSHNAGGDQPHNNMPPYYTINYIIKL
jgi:microcystin-dependent protein